MSTPKQIIVILRWLYGFFVPIADAINPGHAAVSKPANCCSFLVPSHDIPTNDHVHIGQAIDKYRPASRRQLLDTARRNVIVQVYESDAASANITYYETQLAKSITLNYCFMFHVLCWLHQLYLTIGMWLCFIGSDTDTQHMAFIGRLHSSAKLLRQPSYWDRLLLGVCRSIDRFTLIRRDVPWDPAFRCARHTSGQWTGPTSVVSHSDVSLSSPTCPCQIHCILHL